MNKVALVIFLLIVAFVSHAQEQLEGLRFNPVLRKEGQKKAKQIALNKVLYSIDTLELPFVDDFSRNAIKRFEIDIYSPDVVKLPWSEYTFNGASFDTLYARDTVTMNYLVQTSPFQIDSFPADKIEIEVHEKTFENTVTETLSYYPSYSLVSVNFAPPDTIWHDDVFSLINESDTFYIAPDDNSKWIGRGVYINRSFGDISTPTIGVATFDGTDSLGHPYNMSSETAHGLADLITSKPIDLSLLSSADAVILSFYYQPQGLGNDPESNDSLYLDFYTYDPTLEVYRWKRVWAAPGEELKSFTYTEVALDKAEYFHSSFQFRFGNYSTLSGSFDHWNLDYVYLNKNRTAGLEEWNDIGYRSIEELTFLNDFYAVPYDHYKASPSSFMRSSLNAILRSFADIPSEANSSYFVTDVSTDNAIFSSDLEVIPTFFETSEQQETYAVSSSPNDFVFPSTSDSIASFQVNFRCTAGSFFAQEINHDNDTVSFLQHLDSYYAADDGSAELTYSLAGAGSKVAQQFSLTTPDTIFAVLMYVPEILEPISNSFSIKVWADNEGTPGAVLYESNFFTPIIHLPGEGVKFHRYELDTILVVEGAYYIGFEQSAASRIYLGFDANTNNQDKIFYNTEGSWNNTIYEGTLMLRPDFGYSSAIVLKNEEHSSAEVLFECFPNPAQNIVTINSSVSESFEMFDFTGRLVKSFQVKGTTKLSVEDLANGIYFIRATDADSAAPQKLVISK